MDWGWRARGSLGGHELAVFRGEEDYLISDGWSLDESNRAMGE